MDVYIGGLAPEVGEQSLTKLFGAIGKVHSVRLIRDRLSGAPTGFAVIDMETVDGAEQAIAVLNGKSLRGSPITVSKTRPKSRTGPHG